MPQKLYFGVDVGGTFTKIALVDAKGRLIAKSRVSSAGFSDKVFFVKTLRSAIYSILSDSKFSYRQVDGIGVGLPGPVDFKRGVVLSLTNIEGWDRFPLRAYLGRYFDAPVFIENDANCMALAESRMGAAAGSRYSLCVTLGTGVGGGVILDGKIYRGPYFLGGEIGHMPISADGPVCQCGGRACLEKYVGNRYLLERAKRVFRKSIPLEEISGMADSGNKKAVEFWKETGATLGLAIAGFINIFNPEVVVVGGGVAQAGNVLIDSIRKTVERHAMKQLKHKVKIRKAALGNDAGVLGAALLAEEYKSL